MPSSAAKTGNTEASGSAVTAAGSGLGLGGTSVRKPRGSRKSSRKTDSDTDTSAGATSPAAVAAAPEAPERAAAETSRQSRPPTLQLHDIKAAWTRFIQQLPDSLPITLRMAIDSVKPSEVRGKLIMLTCSDTFVGDLVQENITELSRLFGAALGLEGITLRTQIHNNEEEEAAKVAASDPYARFKKLQEKDPRIKTIVDVFGAELQY
ncbi:MAG: hypothetical protein ACOC2C_00730 [Cyclonatronaceae bacterium]